MHHQASARHQQNVTRLVNILSASVAMAPSKVTVAACLLALAALVLAHGDEHTEAGGMDMGMGNGSDTSATTVPEQYKLASYVGLAQHQHLMAVHIVLEVLAWFFLLPLGKCATL